MFQNGCIWDFFLLSIVVSYSWQTSTVTITKHHILFRYINIKRYIMIYHNISFLYFYHIISIKTIFHDISKFLLYNIISRKYFMSGIFLIYLQYIYDISIKYNVFIDISQKMIWQNISNFDNISEYIDIYCLSGQNEVDNQPFCSGGESWVLSY